MVLQVEILQWFTSFYHFQRLHFAWRVAVKKCLFKCYLHYKVYLICFLSFSYRSYSDTCYELHLSFHYKSIGGNISCCDFSSLVLDHGVWEPNATLLHPGQSLPLLCYSAGHPRSLFRGWKSRGFHDSRRLSEVYDPRTQTAWWYLFIPAFF